MKTFLRRYREGSRFTRTAFWVVVVSALLGLATIALDRVVAGRPLERVDDVLSALMFLGLIAQLIGVRRDRRRARD